MNKLYSLILGCLFLSNIVGAQADVDSSSLYLQNAFLLDFNTNSFRIGNLFIENGDISDVEYDNSFKDKVGVININLKGKYIIPGLIDTHIHLGTDPSGSDNLQDTKARLEYLLQHGVTAVRDMAGDTRYLSYLSRQASLDEISAPDIYYSALMAGESFFKDPRTVASAKGYAAGEAPWMKAVNNFSNIDQLVTEAKGTGATGIKIYANLDSNLVAKIVASAHKHDLKVWAHGTVFPARPIDISSAGVDVMSHATLLAWEAVSDIPSEASRRYADTSDFDISNPIFAELMDTMVANNTILDATVAVYKKYGPSNSSVYEKGVALTALAYQNNIKIGVGTDMPIDVEADTVGIITELIALQNDVGMKPIDIIRSATTINAGIIGEADSEGTLEISKKANLVVLNENPLLDISNCSSIEYVFKNGRKVITPILNAPIVLKAPRAWRYEKIDFPIEFAPDITFKGFEELRFSPGMFDPSSDTYFTYVFAVVVEDREEMSKKDIKKFLERYYKGLSREVAKSKDMPVDVSKIKVRIKKAQGTALKRNYYTAKITYLDTFNKGEEIELNMAIETTSGLRKKDSSLLAIVSTKPIGSEIWKSLYEARALARENIFSLK